MRRWRSPSAGCCLAWRRAGWNRSGASCEEHRLELLETVARAGARLGDGELSEAELAARAAIEAAPFRESARVALLEVLRRRGNVAEALVAFDRFRVLLREELGTSPGRELLALHADLLSAGDPPRRSRPTPMPAAAGVSTAPRPSRAGAGRPMGGSGGGARSAARRSRTEAAAGSSGLVLIGGDGGIGKTRLVAELAAALARLRRPLRAL